MSGNHFLIGLLGAGAVAAPLTLPNIHQDLLREFGPCTITQKPTVLNFDKKPNQKQEGVTRKLYLCKDEVGLEFVDEFVGVDVKRTASSVMVMRNNSSQIERAIPISEKFLSRFGCKKIKSQKNELYATDLYECTTFTVKRSNGGDSGSKLFTLEVTIKGF